MGFAFKREILGNSNANGSEKWLRSQKVIKSIVPDPKAALESKDD